MKASLRCLPGALRQIAGLLFDDGSLAIAILVILSATALLVHATGLNGPEAIVFLASAVIAALVENVARTARGHRVVRNEAAAR